MIDIRRLLLYIITLPFLIGVAIGSFWNVSLIICGWVLFLCGVGMIWSFIQRAHPLLAVTFLGLFFFVGGMFAISFAEYRNQTAVINTFSQKEVSLRGVVIEEPEEGSFSQKVKVSVQEISAESATTSISTTILIQAPLSLNLHYGDSVFVQGKLEKPKNFLNDIDREIDYQTMLKKDGVLYVIQKPKVSVISHHNGNYIVATLFSVKQAVVSKLKELLPEPDASLAVGMLVGAKSSLGNSLSDKLRTVGLIHIVVLSGYNIAIVALVLQKIGNVFSRNISFVFSIVGVILFVVMVGGGATVIRAAIMGMLAISTQITRRSYDAGRALWAAAFVMVLLNPYILMFDMSFQLSFLATLGIVYITPILEYFWKSENFQTFKEILTTTISTQIAVAPFLLYQTGSLSVISLFSNMLVVPLTSFLMAISFAVAMVGFINFVLAFPFIFIAHFLFSYMMIIVEYFSTLPFALIKNITLPLWGMGMLYVMLIGIVFYCYKRFEIKVKKI